MASNNLMPAVQLRGVVGSVKPRGSANFFLPAVEETLHGRSP